MNTIPIIPEDVASDVRKHLDVIRTLRAPSGLFLASRAGVETGYDKSWLRDNFYTTLAFEYAGEWDVVLETWRAVLDIFLKHEDKISWAAQNKPFAAWQYIHARYHPETFEEYWEEWGNKQHDAIGAILFKLGNLEAAGKNVLATDDDKRIVQRLVEYLNTIEYWNDPDNGMWEEAEEVHASSVGAVVAGLREVARLPYITVPEGMIARGEETLYALLPRESETKFADLALLSLFYPYDLVPEDRAGEILANIEYHLSRDRGVIRYKTDRYYNRNSDGWSEEAEWTFGFPWLAIIYARRGDSKKAHHYLELARKTVLPTGEIPELYYSNSARANENTPLGWSESLYVAALYEVESEKYKIKSREQ